MLQFARLRRFRRRLVGEPWRSEVKRALGCISGWSWVVILIVTAAFRSSQDARQQPEKGEEILNSACNTGCHDLKSVQVQAMGKDGWTNVVDRMVQRGAEFEKDADIPLLIDYLVQNHGPLPDGRGKPILLNTCTLCHDLKRVLRQGATREQWEETLGAMLNEGAMLSDQDFPVLLDYLAGNFKPQ